MAECLSGHTGLINRDWVCSAQWLSCLVCVWLTGRVVNHLTRCWSSISSFSESCLLSFFRVLHSSFKERHSSISWPMSPVQSQQMSAKVKEGEKTLKTLNSNLASYFYYVCYSKLLNVPNGILPYYLYYYLHYVYIMYFVQEIIFTIYTIKKWYDIILFWIASYLLKKY